MEAISNDLLNAIAINLNGRERQVLEMRLGIGVDRAQTLSEIGEHLNISRERVRQIQKRALSQVGNPILNSMLLVGDLVNPDSVASKKWSKKVETRAKAKYGHLRDRNNDSVKVWLNTSETDPLVIPATWARVDGTRTIFLNDDGEILGDWPTNNVDYVQWPAEEKVKATAESHQERMGKIKNKYPRAWLSWSESEDQSLIGEFARSQDFDSICNAHERAPGGINARLQKLGLIPDSQNTSQTRMKLRA